LINNELSGGEAVMMVASLREKVADLEGLVFAETNAKQAALEHVAALEAELAELKERQWPASTDVGRYGDMSQFAHLRVGLDGDNDVYVSVYDDKGGASIEFCVPGSGGGASPRTREALIGVMVAMEQDNADDPLRDWWKVRGAAPAPVARVEQEAVAITVLHADGMTVDIDWLGDCQPPVGTKLYTTPQPAPTTAQDVIDAIDRIDDFIARCNGDDRGSCEAVNIVRKALTAPAAQGVAGLVEALAKVAGHLRHFMRDSGRLNFEAGVDLYYAQELLDTHQNGGAK
tara:strand:- start:578 stop:1438 length:861 start_codon:yes stop_codon:yes gene_type:complete